VNCFSFHCSSKKFVLNECKFLNILVQLHWDKKKTKISLNHIVQISYCRGLNLDLMKSILFIEIALLAIVHSISKHKRSIFSVSCSTFASEKIYHKIIPKTLAEVFIKNFHFQPSTKEDDNDSLKLIFCRLQTKA
jgi:hypothetical protein